MEIYFYHYDTYSMVMDSTPLYGIKIIKTNNDKLKKTKRIKTK